MSPRSKRRIKRVLKTILLLYIAGGIVLFFMQDMLIFHPTPVPANHRYLFDQPFEELNIPFGSKNLSIVKFKPADRRKGLVLFFHGNMHHVEHYKKYPALFTRNGFEIWMIDYPGFGKTTGKRTEAIIYEQALFMYDMAAREIQNDSIIIYGKSIGTGVASYVASNKPAQRLILETPYRSIDALAKHYFPMYPVIPMTRYTFPIHKYLSQLKIPVTIFHGTSDEVVPYRQGRQLSMENQHVELITLEKGKHNNLFEFRLYQVKMDSLLGGRY